MSRFKKVCLNEKGPHTLRGHSPPRTSDAWNLFVEVVPALRMFCEWEHACRKRPGSVSSRRTSQRAPPCSHRPALLRVSLLIIRTESNRNDDTRTKFCPFAIGRPIFVEQRVVAVVGKAKAVILTAIPAVVKAVAEPVCLLYRLDAALRNGALLLHAVLGIGGLGESIDYAHGYFAIIAVGVGAGI
jgi:hypothetical protein